MEGFAVLAQCIAPLIFGIACAAIASGKGRSPVGWFFIGFFANCIGIILLLVLPDPRAERARHDRLRTENRRLREKLEKDRMVADRRHAETNRRLEVHDTALGVDTAPALPERPRGELTAGDEPAAAPPTGPPSPHHDQQWYYAMDSQESPPLSFSGLQRLWERGQVNERTLVWSSGMAEWQPIAAVDGLEDALRG